MDTDVQTYVTSHSHEPGYAGRIEVVTGPTGRRRWPEHVKAAMVLAPPSSSEKSLSD
jgi:transposase